jgi:hypothetical protein
MKLRIKGNSLRLRVSRSDVKRLMNEGMIEESIRFAPEEGAALTYALEQSSAEVKIAIRYRAQRVTVALRAEDALRWADGEDVGIYANVNVGTEELAILVEKDFACLDGNDAENEDTFANPNLQGVC